MVRQITNETAKQKIADIADGHIFHVAFIKRTDGTVRNMQCRKGVAIGIVGVGQGFKPEDHNLITVFDVVKARELEATIPEGANKGEIAKIKRGAYRCINLETIIDLTIAGEMFHVNDFPVRDWEFTWVSGGSKLQRVVKGRTEGEAKITFKRETDMRRTPKNTVIVLLPQE